MITKEEFFKAVETHQKFEEAIERVANSISGDNHSVYLYESDWYEAEGKLFDLFLKSHFTDEACDDIYWWLYEGVDKVFYVTTEADIFNEEKEEIVPVRTLGQLWNFFEREPEVYFK